MQQIGNSDKVYKIYTEICNYINNRAMAVSISFMFGRFGGVTGTNAAALLLDNHCETTFFLSGSLQIGN